MNDMNIQRGIVNIIQYLPQRIVEKNFMGIIEQILQKILSELCKCKGKKIINAEVCPDYIHMFVEIPPKISISSFMGFLKCKSSIMRYER